MHPLPTCLPGFHTQRVGRPRISPPPKRVMASTIILCISFLSPEFRVPMLATPMTNVLYETLPSLKQIYARVHALFLVIDYRCTSIHVALHIPEQPILAAVLHASGSPTILFRLMGSDGGSVVILAPGHDVRFCSLPRHLKPVSENERDTGWLPSFTGGFRGIISKLGGKLRSNPSWLQAVNVLPGARPSPQTVLHRPSSSHTSRKPVESALLKVSLVSRKVQEELGRSVRMYEWH